MVIPLLCLSKWSPLWRDPKNWGLWKICKLILITEVLLIEYLFIFLTYKPYFSDQTSDICRKTTWLTQPRVIYFRLQPYINFYASRDLQYHWSHWSHFNTIHNSGEVLQFYICVYSYLYAFLFLFIHRLFTSKILLQTLCWRCLFEMVNK